MNNQGPTQEICHRFLILASNGNVGDYAMLSNVVRRLRARFDGCEIDVLAARRVDYDELPGVRVFTYGEDHFSSGGGSIVRMIERLPKGRRLAMMLRCAVVVLAARSRGKWIHKRLWTEDCRALIETLAGASCIISCGGGYLNSLWWAQELWPKCACYAAGTAMGKPVVLSGQGIGPITSRADRIMLKWGLRGATWISLREKGEGEGYIKSLGVSPNILGVAGDDAVDLPVCTRERINEILLHEGIDRNRETVMMNARLAGYSQTCCDGHTVLLASLADRLIEQNGWQVVFIALSFEDLGGADDRAAASAVSTCMRNRDDVRIVMGKYSPSEIKGIMGLCTVAFGMSYHFAVFALTQGIPCFTLYDTEYYRLKCSGLYSQIGRDEWFQPLNEQGVSTVLALAELEKDDAGDTREHLRNRTGEMIGRVDSVYDRIESLLQSGAPQ